MRRIPLPVLILCIATLTAFSQGEVPVDMYTGQPSITVPLWTVSSGDVSQPVVLSYNANGIQARSTCGPGWSISAGGSVSRELRTYPDDIGYSLTTKGWLYTNSSSDVIATDIGNFVPAADNSTTYDAGEGTDFTKINGFNYAVDTEPDIFHYSAGGISGSFVFDNALGIRTIPYADVVITPTYTGGGNQKITKFTITNNAGFVYTFDYAVSVTRSVAEIASGTAGYFRAAEYEFYNPSVTYTKEWRLTRIDSPDGAYITYTYSTENDVHITNVEIGQYQEPDEFYHEPSDLITLNPYKISETNPLVKILSITGSTGSSVEFSYDGGLLQSVTAKDTRRGTTSPEQKVRTFAMEYLPVTYMRDGRGNFPAYTEQFLKSVTESLDCERLAPYTFWYLGLYQVPSTWGNFGYCLPYPERVDLYGQPFLNKNPFQKIYIYPDEPITDRYRTSPIPSPTPGYSGDEYTISGNGPGSSNKQDGLLESITTPEGGVTTFHFEGNDYLDPGSSLVENASGFRISRIDYHDGVNYVPITKTFRYVDPATGLSSGRIIRKPALAMPTYKWRGKISSQLSDEEERFKKLLIRCHSNQAEETTHGNPVGYKIVTVSRPGAGFARFEFSLPATYADGTVGDWIPTVNKFARKSTDSSVPLGVVDGASAWSFPFTPNPNYDYERGLLLKKSDYTSDSVLVQQTVTTYQTLYKTGSAPHPVYGLRYDSYPGYTGANKIFFYGRYFLLTDVITVPAKEVSKRFDLTDATGNTWQKDSVEYVYGSSYHKLLTQIKRHTVNGDLYTTRLKYPKDYTGTSATGAADAVAIHTMKSNNRHSMPIETIQTFKKAGNDTVWVVGGTVAKLADFSGTTRVRSVWSLSGSGPFNIADFGESAVYNSSGYKYRIDTRYRKIDSVMAYTNKGNVSSAYSPLARKNSATGYGYGSSLPVVQLVNATSGEAAFADFDTAVPGFSFSSSTPYYGTGRTGKNGFYPGVTLVDTVSKANVSNYILSFWINCNATIYFTVDLKNLSGTALSPAATTSFNVTTTGGSAYKYVQQVIPIPGNVPSSFRIEFKATGLTTPPSGGSAPGLLPVIDDVFFYPENADMVASQYQVPTGTVSVTTGTGGGAFNEYDKLGRLHLIYDKNKDIVKRNIYQYASVNPLNADFTASSLVAGTTTTFTAVPNDCVIDATYEWDIGPGFEPGSNTLSEEFEVGTYEISMRITSATYGTKTKTDFFTVKTSPFEIDICAKGAVYFIDDEPDIYAVCPSISETPRPDGVIFKVTPGVSGPFTYQWKMRPLGSPVWVNVGTDSELYDFQPVSTEPEASYEVMCVVSLENGSFGFSPKIQVVFED